MSVIGLQVGAAVDSPVVAICGVVVGDGVLFPADDSVCPTIVFSGTSDVSATYVPWFEVELQGRGSLSFVDSAFTIPYDLSASSPSAHGAFLSLSVRGWAFPAFRPDLVWDMAGSSSLSTSLANLFRSVSFPGTSDARFDISTTATRDLSVAFPGSSSVTFGAFGVDPKYQPRTLYLYLNVGVGFNIDAPTGAVSFTAPDGQVRSFPRWLYLYLNVGVGFNRTDDASGRPGFVSQTFPDGNTWEFPRWLYLLLYVYAPPDEFGRGYYGPAPRLGTVTRAKPPQLPYP